VRIALAGEKIEATLAKGTGVDPAMGTFPVGLSVLTLIGHTSAHLTRVGDSRFEILVMRSFALSLWDELIDMGLEFGISAQAT
jgi:sarcosine oxidase subunit gamma